jgi:hypothetical protein
MSVFGYDNFQCINEDKRGVEKMDNGGSARMEQRELSGVFTPGFGPPLQASESNFKLAGDSHTISTRPDFLSAMGIPVINPANEIRCSGPVVLASSKANSGPSGVG